MGRPKVDHSQTACQVCGTVGNYAAKGMCRQCYGHAAYKAAITDEDVKAKRREYARQWNKTHQEQFKANKELSAQRRKAIEAGLPFEEPVNVKAPERCSDCDFVGYLFAKGRCLSCYGKHRNKLYGPKRKPHRMAKQYGITPEEYLAMVENAGGRCEVCNKECANLCVDHDHKTRKVRGLLCSLCNFLVGHLENNEAETLAAAHNYLEKHRLQISQEESLPPQHDT